MKYYQIVVGKTRQDRLRNGKIRDDIGQFKIEGRLKIKQLKWFGHEGHIWGRIGS